jgi:hypothetical protein
MITNDCGAAAIDTLMPLGDNNSRDGKIYGWQICDRLADCVQNPVSRL